MAQSHSQDVLANFAHQLRQPLSTLGTLVAYLEMIIPVEDLRIREQLRKMHVEIDLADQVLTEGLRDISECISNHDRTVFAVSPDGVVDELSRPLTKTAMASVT